MKSLYHHVFAIKYSRFMTPVPASKRKKEIHIDFLN